MRKKQSRVGVRERLLGDDLRVGERGHRGGAGGREQRRGLADDRPREEVRREDDRGHREDADVANEVVRLGRRVDPPGGRREVRVERLEEVGPPRRAASPVSAMLRESCVSSSSSVKSHGEEWRQDWYA